MRIMSLIYPSKCVFCGSVLHGNVRGACPSCERQLPYVTEPACVHCGKPVMSPEQSLCGDCAAGGHGALTRSVALWLYREEDTKKAMIDFKYGGCTADAGYYARVLTERFSDRIRSWRPEVIVPVPIHRRRMRFRGYNQAELLAREMGAMTGIPVASLLKRTRYTTPQKELPPAERRKNLREAFAVDGVIPLPYRRVLLVDDVYTTGATLEACAGLLREAGAEEVYGACLCIGSDY